MIPYLNCAAAVDRLEPFVDGELSVDEQVALESHLRWCSVCEARLDDMQLIGASLRMRHQRVTAESETSHALAAMRSSVLERVRAEHNESMPVVVGQMFADMRFLWPALGATAAVLACVVAASGVFNAATGLEQRDSLAGLIDMLANPGSDSNPRVLDAGDVTARRLSLPRALEPGHVLDGVAADDVAFAVSAVVTREGRITNSELLLSERSLERRRQRAAELDVDAPAVLDAVKRSRFAPAHDAQGPVAVNVVWLVTRTTVKAPAPAQVIRLKPAPPVAVDTDAVDEVVRPPVEIEPGADLKTETIDPSAVA